MKHVFLINPTAGKGKFYEAIKPQIEECCKKNGLDFEIVTTKASRDGLRIVKEMAATGENIRFYACGGDGTLYEVVNGAYGYDNVEVAVIPLGSGNDFIRLFGSKEDFLELDNVINGVPVRLDVIKCGDEIAINQCSMGLDAEVCAKQAEFKKLPLVTGEGAYVASSLYCLLKKVKNTFTITIDDGEPFTRDCIFCFCGNSRWYGGGFKGGPLAMPDDGLLDFIIVEKKCTRAKLVTLLGSYKKGEHLSWDMTTFVRGKKLTIHSKNPAAVNVDGECTVVNDCTFEIVEDAITFVVPKNSEFLNFRTQKETN